MLTLFFSIVTACINNCEFFSSSRLVRTCHSRKLEDFFVWFTGIFPNNVQASRWIFRHLLAVYMPMSTASTWKCGVSLKINKEPWNDSYWSVVFCCKCFLEQIWKYYWVVQLWLSSLAFVCFDMRKTAFSVDFMNVVFGRNWAKSPRRQTEMCPSLRIDLWAFVLHRKSYASQIWSVVCKL